MSNYLFIYKMKRINFNLYLSSISSKKRIFLLLNRRKKENIPTAFILYFEEI
jgi:hypothetical protein